MRARILLLLRFAFNCAFDSGWLRVDSAYRSTKIEGRLRASGFKSRIHRGSPFADKASKRQLMAFGVRALAER
jgi:hypothetical protein